MVIATVIAVVVTAIPKRAVLMRTVLVLIVESKWWLSRYAMASIHKHGRIGTVISAMKIRVRIGRSEEIPAL